MPMIENVLNDTDRKIKYIVEAPTHLSRGEVMLVVLRNLRKQRRRTKAGDIVRYIEPLRAGSNDS